MNQLNLTILQKIPEPNLDVILEIKPLAPLSMVTELPGSYYKTLKSPDKKVLCGLFENILGWHIDLEDRKAITQELIEHRKKQKMKYQNGMKGSTYVPLLWEYFEIELPLIPTQLGHYDDLWSRAFRRADSHRHTFGTRYMDSDFIERWSQIKDRVDIDNKRRPNEKGVLLDKLFKRYMGKFPMYYSTPTKREYTQYSGNFQIKLLIDPSLFEQLVARLQNENIGYLGNSEGWVNLTIKEFKL